MEAAVANEVVPGRVMDILKRHLLTTGMMPMVLDMERSRGLELYDHVTGKRYLDFFGFYASSVLGMNSPELLENEDFMRRLQEVAVNKITNSDIATLHSARFVQTFDRVAIPDYLPYAFFISGGALAVENALKAAFDWKVRKNFQKGYRRELGSQILHFDQAFHGRSGYTLSLTNTADPRKTQYFPKFNWPRVLNPKMSFPFDDKAREEAERAEALALSQAKMHFHERKDDIAAIIIEPIQGEGGDNHFRREFLLQLKDLALENDALLIFDEVQTGVGITGSFWAHQALGVEPDLIAYGKKTQVCGILAGRRLDEVEGHVFKTPSRINSTWGGNLVDMVRFDRVLEVVEEKDLLEQSAERGKYLIDRLRDLAAGHPIVSNVRGRGLMCAFDLPEGRVRDALLERCFERGLIVLGSGRFSVRFRSPLVITNDQIDEGVEIIGAALRTIEKEHRPLENSPLHEKLEHPLREE